MSIKEVKKQKYMLFSRNDAIEKLESGIKKFKQTEDSNDLLFGKWLIFHEKWELIFEIWKKLKKNNEVLLMKLPNKNNKLSGNIYLLTIYNLNYKDVDEIKNLLKIIRICGANWKVYYKREIETFKKIKGSSYYTSEDFEV